MVQTFNASIINMKKEMLMNERNILQNYMHSWTSLWEGEGGKGKRKKQKEGKEHEEEKRKEERKGDSLDIKKT